MTPDMDMAAFKHTFPVRVRTFQVDRQNVVHNVWYFYYFEAARVEFMRDLGFSVDEDTFIEHTKFYIARNTCDYYAPGRFDKEILIHSRISRVGDSSVTFEHIALQQPENLLLAKGTHIMVHVNAQTDKPERLPDSIRQLIRKHEGGSVFSD
jgi:acyl-CoA thioester hydrolase